MCHYPPGTSKWNPIEHRLFSEMSTSWAGCPLRSFDLLLQYLRATKTQTGLRVQAHLAPETYASSKRVSDELMATRQIEVHAVCPQWDYTIRPRAATPGVAWRWVNLYLYELLVQPVIGRT